MRHGKFYIILLAMEVFIELALLENFCMDYTLLYCAKLVAKNPSGIKRVAVASVLGACFAVLFPLLKLNAVFAAVVKALSGLLLCLVAGKFRSVKGYLKFTAVFFAFSAALAGALYAVFSLTGMEYAEGGGYILSPVPIGIPMFGALILIVVARRIKDKFSRGNRREVDLKISVGDKSVSLVGFFDSGNKVSFRGEPVSIIPQSTAEKLTDVARITDGVKIHTVTGSKQIKVFTADKLEVDFGGEVKTYGKVKIGVSAAHIACAVLHPDIMED